MRKISSGHYVSDEEGINIYLVVKRVCSDKIRKSGRSFADYRTERYWNFTLKNRDGESTGYSTKTSALSAARRVISSTQD